MLPDSNLEFETTHKAVKSKEFKAISVFQYENWNSLFGWLPLQAA
jgi:hypothetical protein